MFAEQKKQLIDVLIWTEAIRQEAAKSDIAKDPEVALKIKLQSEQILVEAYLTQLAEAKITEDELKKNYEDIKLIQLRNDTYNLTTFTITKSEDAEAVKAVMDAEGDVSAKLTELSISGESSQKSGRDYDADPAMKSNLDVTSEGSRWPLPFWYRQSVYTLMGKRGAQIDDVKDDLKQMALQNIPDLAEEI